MKSCILSINITMMKNFYLYTIMTLVSLIFFHGCSLSSNNGPLMVEASGESITIGWEPPSPVLSGKIDYYSIYVKDHFDGSWVFLKDVGNSGEEEITVQLQKQNIPYTYIDIGIRSHYKDGSKSELHSSLDNTASPACGWYVYWSQE